MEIFWGIVIIITIFGAIIKVFTGNSSENNRPKPISPEKLAEQEKALKLEQEKGNIKYHLILTKYKSYVDKFCEIAEREVSAKDEWGDENWNVLPRLKKECVERIGRQACREHFFSKDEEYSIKDVDNWFDYASYPKGSKEVEVHRFSIPSWGSRLFSEDLDISFNKYHETRKGRYLEDGVNTSNMSGVEFENYLMSVLKGKGYSTSGTPTTGDQGADIVASKENKVYVIQAKRHSKPIGNKAIQEVVAARNYYNGDVGIVITNNIFTPSAKSLARRNNIILVNGKEIPMMDSILRG